MVWPGIDPLLKVANLLAVAAGGSWVYFNSIRGRAFVPRLELQLSGRRMRAGEIHYLLVTMRFKNVGASIVDVVSERSGLRVTPIANGKDELGPQTLFRDENHLYWERKTLPVLLRYNVRPPEKGGIQERRHRKIEPGTSIFEQRLIVIPGNDEQAYELELVVYVRRWQYMIGNWFRFPPWDRPQKAWNALALVPMAEA